MIKNKRDFWSGLLFVAFGLFFCLYSIYNYRLGTAARMGPGYFPMVLGGILCALGLVVSTLAIFLKPQDGDNGAIGRFDWFSFAIILGSVAVFAITLRPLGLILSTGLMVFISSIANRRFRFLETILLCAVMCFIVWLVFIFGLDLLVPVWPSFIDG